MRFRSVSWPTYSPVVDANSNSFMWPLLVAGSQIDLQTRPLARKVLEIFRYVTSYSNPPLVLTPSFAVKHISLTARRPSKLSPSSVPSRPLPCPPPSHSSLPITRFGKGSIKTFPMPLSKLSSASSDTSFCEGRTPWFFVIVVARVLCCCKQDTFTLQNPNTQADRYE